MKKIIMSLGVITPLLTGCGVGHTEYSKEAYKRTDFNFVGIPTILGAGISGTSVPISPDYSLTAAHIAKLMMYRVKAYHPDCDLALIYHRNHEKSYPAFRENERGEKVNMYGYSFMSGMPVESSGTSLGDTVTQTGYNNELCKLAYTTAGAVPGMAGGAVYNSRDNTLAGIIEGYSSKVTSYASNTETGKTESKDVSLYVPYKNFSKWLKEKMAG